MTLTFRLCAAAAALMLSLTLQAGAHKERFPLVPITVDPAVEAGVTATLRATEARWNAQDFGSILELWDKDEAFPTYLAEEQAQWFVGWDRLKGYLDPPRPIPFIEALRLDFYNIQVKQIAPDLAIGIWEFHFEMKTIGSKPFGEALRASGVFRKKGEQWKWIHYAESPKGPKIFLEDLMEQQVRDDWDEFYEQAKKSKQEVWRRKREAQAEN